MLFPNPTDGHATLAFELPAEQPFTLRIFDLSGRMIYDQESMGAASWNEVPLQLDAIEPGLYIVDFRSGDFRSQQRLLLQR